MSRHGVVWIDGVPIPSAAFGNVEMAGARLPMPLTCTTALIVVFCAGLVDLAPDYVTGVAADARPTPPDRQFDGLLGRCSHRSVASATATTITPVCTSKPP